MILSVCNIYKSFGDNVILDNVSFLIEEGEKAAVVGINGAGKTTLFKIVAGIIAADEGSVTVAKDTKIAYLEQNMSTDSDLTIYDEMMSAFSHIIEAENKMRELEVLMSTAENEAYNKLAEEYNETLRYYEENDGYSYKSHVRGVIAGLGLDGDDISAMKVSALSGGQKTRVALGVRLLKKPDILLLDEPTNHLDIDSVSWLEGYLKSYTKTVLVISHDRYFMDSVVSKIIDVEHTKVKVYNSSYSSFIERKRINEELYEKQYSDWLKERKKQEESIRLLKSYNREKTVRRAESKEKLLQKQGSMDKPLSMPDSMRLSLTPKMESGYDVLTVCEIYKGFAGKSVLTDISFDIKKEERVALIGSNGIGKSTLLKIIAGEMASDSGTVKTGVNAKIGYYDQEQKNIDEEKTVIGHVNDKYPAMKDSDIRNVLASFLFKGDDIYKKASALSGGERGRLCLCLLMLGGANFLILDEPTNHLDMYSKEILEGAVSEFKGTMLYVSHDRYFINKTATKVIEMTKEGITAYLGNYDYYLRKKAESLYINEQEGERVNHKEKGTGKKSERQKMKEAQSQSRKRENLLQKIEGEILEVEERIAKCEASMCLEEVFTDAQKAKAAYDLKVSLESELETLYEKWEMAEQGTV